MPLWDSHSRHLEEFVLADERLIGLAVIVYLGGGQFWKTG
jgi:hypothetical protein